MNNQAIITSNIDSRKKINLSLINWVNNFVKNEAKNALGIKLMYIMVGTGIASLTAALSISGNISIAFLMISTSLAMGTNVAILSQQTFKTTTWFFIANVIINIFLLIYQLAN